MKDKGYRTYSSRYVCLRKILMLHGYGCNSYKNHGMIRSFQELMLKSDYKAM
jgi:hypothetical protein